MRKLYLVLVILATLALLLALQIPALGDVITNPDSWRLSPGS